MEDTRPRSGSRGGKAPKRGKKSSGAKKESPFTKTQLVSEIAQMVECEKKLAAEMLDALEEITLRQLKQIKVASPLPGLVKIAVVDKPARDARDGINPKTGEKIRIPAKPASKTIKVRALKRLKDAAPSR